jgi:hypothetical protein
MVATVILASLLNTSVAMGSAAPTDNEAPQPELFGLLEKTRNSSIVRGQGLIFDDDFMNGMSYLTSGGQLCSSLSDQVCSNTKQNSAEYHSVLGICETASELACIENVMISIDNSAATPLELEWVGSTVFEEIANLGIPRGSTWSRWRAPNGTKYALLAAVSGSLNRTSGSWTAKPADTSFRTSIYRIPANPPFTWGGQPTISIQPNEGGGRDTACSGCGPGSNSIIPPLPNTQYTLTARLPLQISNWFQGRLANAKVGSVPLDENRARYTFSGSPVPTYIAAIEANSDDPNFPFTRTSQNTNGFSVHSMQASYFWKYKELEAFLRPKALITKNEWSIQTFAKSGNANQICIDSVRGVPGVASTNASVFSPEPPVLNMNNGQLEYSVASPHFDELGNTAVGHYSFSVPLAFLKCLFGTVTIPTDATMTATYENNNFPYSITENLTISDNWANFSTNGFHYSSPKLGIKFLHRNSKGQLISVSLSVKSGKVKKGTYFAVTSLSSPSSKTKQKWSVTGPCQLRDGIVKAVRKGTCKFTLRTLSRKNRYVISFQKSVKVT